MKKLNVIPCALAVALLGAITAGSAVAAKKPMLGQHLPRATMGDMSDNQTFERLIVTYRDGTKAKIDRNAAVAGVNAAAARTGLFKGAGAASAKYVRTLATGQQLLGLSRKIDRAEAAALMAQIASDPNVAHVAPDVRRYAVRDVKATSVQPAFVPNDPYFANYQWHLRAPDGAATTDGGPNRGGANASAGWDLADGNGIVIAILDTGITRHPDLDTTLGDAGYDFTSTSINSGRPTDGRAAGGWDTGDWTTEEPYLSACTSINNPPSDSSWHGTHVAATAGAELNNNSMGMAGVAYGAKILPVRVLGHCGGYDSDINDAIVWAAGGTVAGVPANANPAKVINLSLGGSGTCTAADATAQAIATARGLGASVVISAGNSQADAGGYFPASCPGAITVASNGVGSRRAYYSNYGATVEIAAPGGGVYLNEASSGTQINNGFVWQALNPGTKAPVALADIDPANDYGGYAGTSQAAPHVAGVIAMMQGARLDAELPLLTPDEVVAMLQDTATPFTVAPPANRAIGAGIVNAGAAVAAAIEPPCEVDCAPDAIPLTNKVVVSGLSGAADSEVLYSFDATAGAVLSFMTYGGSGDVQMYVSFDEEPTTTDFDAKSARAGNSETVRFTAPQAGTYYIKLVGARAYSNVSLVARQ